MRRFADGGGWRLAEAPAPLDPEGLLAAENACDAYATLQAATLPPLPAAVAERLNAADALSAARLLEAEERFHPWPEAGDAMAMERSTEPLYVRQAVFVRPAELRK